MIHYDDFCVGFLYYRRWLLIYSRFSLEVVSMRYTIQVHVHCLLIYSESTMLIGLHLESFGPSRRVGDWAACPNLLVKALKCIRFCPIKDRYIHLSGTLSFQRRMRHRQKTVPDSKPFQTKPLEPDHTVRQLCPHSLLNLTVSTLTSRTATSESSPLRCRPPCPQASAAPHSHSSK
jgi:hypothetical protein